MTNSQKALAISHKPRVVFSRSHSFQSRASRNPQLATLNLKPETKTKPGACISNVALQYSRVTPSKMLSLILTECQRIAVGKLLGNGHCVTVNLLAAQNKAPYEEIVGTRCGWVFIREITVGKVS